MRIEQPVLTGRQPTNWGERELGHFRRLGLRRIDERLFAPGQYHPVDFWRDVTSTITDKVIGTGKSHDRTEIVHKWLNGVYDRLQDEDVTLVADFIQEGQRALLEAYKSHVSNGQMSRELADLYVGLLQDNRLGQGWEQAHRDYIEDIRGTNPTVISNWVATVNDPVYGVNGSHPIMVGDQHFSTFEFGQFMNDQQISDSTPAFRAKMFDAVSASVLPGIKLSTEPAVTAALGTAFTTVVSVTKDGYGKREAEILTSIYDQSNNQTDENVRESSLRQITSSHMKKLDRITDPAFGVGGKVDLTESVLDLFESEIDAVGERHPLIQGVVFEEASEYMLRMLARSRSPRVQELYQELVRERLLEGQEKMLQRRLEDPSKAQLNTKILVNELMTALKNPAYGIGGEVSVADTIESRLKKLLKVAERYKPAVQADVFGAVESGVLETVKETRSHALRDMYLSLADQLPDGQEFVRHSSLSADQAQIVVKAYIDAMTDPVYGVGGEVSLVEVFEKRFKAYLKAVSGHSSDVQLTVYQQAEKSVREAIATVDPTKAKALKSLYEATVEVLPKAYTERLVQEMCAEPDEAFITAEVAKVDAQSQGDADLREQVITAHRESAMRAFWTEYVTEITDSNYGAAGARVDLSETIRKRMLAVRGSFEHMDPAWQYRFYQVGREVILLEMKKSPNKVLAREYRELAEDIHLEAGRKYGVRAIQEGADAFVAQELKKVQSGDERAKAKAADESYITYMREYWDTYLDRQFDAAYAQGTFADISKVLQAEMNQMMDAMKDLDYTYTGTFMQAGVDAYLERIKATQDYDQRQRLVFQTFALLTHSPIAIRMEEREGEYQWGLQGAKRVRTIGSLQVGFIRRVIEDQKLIGAFTQYIEAKLKQVDPATGQRVTAFKDHRELRLCMDLLLTNRDNAVRRKGEETIRVGEFDIAVGKAPDPEEFAVFENGLIASLENGTSVIRSGDHAPFMEILAAIGSFSPYTLSRLATPTVLGRLEKNTRKFGKDSEIAQKRRAVIHQIMAVPNLSAAARFNLIYLATGKMDFDIELTRRVAHDGKTAEIIKTASQYEGVDSLEHLLTFRDDVCQVASVPGIQPVFGEYWQPGSEMTETRRKLFGKYIALAVARIRDPQFNKDPKLSAMAATELLGISMMLEKVDGENDEVKTGPHQMFSELLIDILTDTTGVFADSVKQMARTALRTSVPYWSLDRVTGFIDAIDLRVNTTDLHKWIEGNHWKELMYDLAIVNGMPPEKGEADSRMIRKKIAHHICKATMDILEGYATMGGRSALRSPIDIVTGEQSDVWSPDTYFYVPQDGNFIEQAIDMITWYGSEQDKSRLPAVLERLGREDLLWFAQTKEMTIDQPATTFLITGERVLGDMQQIITTSQAQFQQLIADVSAGSQPLVRVEEGRIVGLPEESKLLARLKKDGVKKLEQLVASVKLPEREEQVQNLRGTHTGTLTGLSGVDLVKQVIAESAQFTGQPEVLDRLFEALGKMIGPEGAARNLQAVKETGRIDVDIDRTNTMGMGTVLADIANSRAEGMQAIERMLGFLRDDKQFGINQIMAMLQEAGSTATYAQAEQMKRLIIESISAVLTDEAKRTEMVGGFRQAHLESLGRDIALIDRLREEYVTGAASQAGQVILDESEAIEQELEIIKRQRQARYTAQQAALTEFERMLAQQTRILTETRAKYAQRSLDSIVAFDRWLERVSAPEGPLAKRAQMYAVALSTRKRVFIDREGLILPPDMLLEQIGLGDSYRQLTGRKHNKKAQKKKT